MQTSLLSSWLPSIVAFAVTFVVASLLSAFTYWLGHFSSNAMRWVKIVFSTIASLFALIIFVAILGTFSLTPAILGVLLIVIASGIQASLERTTAGNSLTFKRQFARSFFTYVSTVFTGYLVAIIPVALIARSAPIAGSGPTSGMATWDFMAMYYGFLAGLLIAPLSISFYRLVFQSIQMRPGMDRLLSEEELRA